MRERLERNGYGFWVVEVKGGASFVGVVALMDVPSDLPFAPALEVGWRLRYASWGRGYATEGARRLLAFAFDELERDEVVSITAAINLRSQRVMQRLGMTRDLAGDFEHPRIAPGHRIRPHVLYRLPRERFLSCAVSSFALRIESSPARSPSTQSLEIDSS
jgi:ribosomal-protein-alanine N-acetyltransferase